MSRRGLHCSGSLSRGSALMRVVIAAALVLAVWFTIRTCFPSREARLWRFIDDGREALLENRRDDFLAHFDPAVVYRQKGGLEEIRRDWARWRGAGIGSASIVSSQTSFDDDGANVKFEVVFVAGLTPVSKNSVQMRVAERDGRFSVTSLTWE